MLKPGGKRGGKRGHCGTCDPAPKGRVSADELWRRAMAAPAGYRVRV